ncbi:MAG: hypothetical protein ABJQ85_02135 [Rhizobiaceae bacterium]
MANVQTVARENLLRIAEILTLLGFLHTPRYFAEFHLGLDQQHVDWFVRGNLQMIQLGTVRHLRDKLSFVHEVLAQEVADAADIHELWLAQARYNLLQTAFAHLN